MKAGALIKKNTYPALWFARFFSALMRLLSSPTYNRFYGFEKSQLFSAFVNFTSGGAKENFSFKINLN
ncbi:hypothetical protein WH96_08410 [Kiloniella spongiae]|uniref:Uncharacterized protein n=2 Tax=Kiloniella spongiae TaxID=1489064 RepID=A0A0H2MK91_9PROT|nr:hypothetical protein WH96_08410 [Kiloniella spongiae]